MRVWSESFSDGGPISDACGFCVPATEGHVTFAPNRNPHLAWDGAPAGTRSFVITCVDQSAPTVGDDVNKEGRTIPKSLPRAEFTHWLLVGVDASAREIAEGGRDAGVVPRGRATADGAEKTGLNDYTGWFAGDADMDGSYFGYDGPCPPWNDELVHEYVFTVMALDTETLDLPTRFTLADLRAAVAGHVLDSASITGTYTLNPALRG